MSSWHHYQVRNAPEKIIYDLYSFELNSFPLHSSLDNDAKMTTKPNATLWCDELQEIKFESTFRKRDGFCDLDTPLK